MIYLVTDELLLEGKNIFEIIEAAARGGVGMVQLREKHSTTRQYIDKAIIIKKILAPYKIPLIINDRVDVALASDADGVHIGQSDMDYFTTRRLMPQGKIIGLSVESKEQALIANEFDVDYIAASPVFSTPTKHNTITEWGLDGIQWLKNISRHKIVAIGGLNKSNIKKIYEAGADSIAVISAIISSEDPEVATRNLVDIPNKFINY